MLVRQTSSQPEPDVLTTLYSGTFPCIWLIVFHHQLVQGVAFPGCYLLELSSDSPALQMLGIFFFPLSNPIEQNDFQTGFRRHGCICHIWEAIDWEENINTVGPWVAVRTKQTVSSSTVWDERQIFYLFLQAGFGLEFENFFFPVKIRGSSHRDKTVLTAIWKLLKHLCTLIYLFKYRLWQLENVQFVVLCNMKINQAILK